MMETNGHRKFVILDTLLGWFPTVSWKVGKNASLNLKMCQWVFRKKIKLKLY